MSKKKGVPGYPAADLLLMDIINIEGREFIVYSFDAEHVYLHLLSDEDKRTLIIGNCTVRLIRKANGQTYATWQRRTSKILKAMGLSKWPGAVMHEYFFNSVSPEEAAAGFMADHFEVDFIPIKFMEQ